MHGFFSPAGEEPAPDLIQGAAKRRTRGRSTLSRNCHRQRSIASGEDRPTTHPPLPRSPHAAPRHPHHQGRRRRPAGLRPRHRRGAGSRRRGVRLRLDQTILREMVGRHRRHVRRQVLRQPARDARPGRRRQGHGAGLQRRGPPDRDLRQGRRRRRVGQGDGGRVHRLQPRRPLRAPLDRRGRRYALHRRAPGDLSRRPALPRGGALRDDQGRRRARVARLPTFTCKRGRRRESGSPQQRGGPHPHPGDARHLRGARRHLSRHQGVGTGRRRRRPVGQAARRGSRAPRRSPGRARWRSGEACRRAR